MTTKHLLPRIVYGVLGVLLAIPALWFFCIAVFGLDPKDGWGVGLFALIPASGACVVIRRWYYWHKLSREHTDACKSPEPVAVGVISVTSQRWFSFLG
jgi:hypothetical protein